MANLPETTNFDSNIYEIATSDQVLGGDATTIANKQAASLANRTQWLKAQVETIEDNQAIDETNIAANTAAISSLTSRIGVDEGLINTLNTEVADLYTKILPVGSSIIWNIGTALPANFLEENGASVSRTTYAALFAVFGTFYGSIDSAHFNLPDSRGQFIRGWSHGSSIDSGRSFYSPQADTFQDHEHNVNAPFATVGGGGSAGGLSSATGHTPAFPTTGAITGNPGTETRPTNLAKMFIIKY